MSKTLRAALAATGVIAGLTVGGQALAGDGGRPLQTSLTGAEECNAAGVCNLGDPDGSGSASLRLNPGREQICFTIKVDNIDLPATGAHIHEAPAGSAGPVVVPLPAPTGETTTGCVSAERSLIKEIMRDPDEYYVNIHTAPFPGGAVRGQL